MKTFYGFYAILLPQATTGITYMLLICVLVNLQIGMCSYIEAFTLDFRQIVGQMDEFTKLDSLQTGISQNKVKLRLLLKELIEMHNAILK